MQNKKCKICRRVGAKLFLKGEKCVSSKCPMIKRAYAPGFQGTRRRRRKTFSGYAKQLQEKQKLKNFYNLNEGQFKKYIKGTLKKRGRVEDAQTVLVRKLEKRLDNVVFRLGFAASRSQARQLVSHGHFLVNGKKVNIPSYQVEKGDEINIHSSGKKPIFRDLSLNLKKQKVADWLILDIKSLKGKIIGEPSLEDAAPPAEISAIFEYYSR